MYVTSRDPNTICTVLDQLLKTDRLAQESEQRLVQKLKRKQTGATGDDLDAVTKELEEEKVVLTRLVQQVDKIMTKEEADACLIDRYAY